MATVIEELVSKLGFEIDDKKLTDFNKRSERLKTNLKRIGIIASAAAVGITAWVSKVGIATDANIKFADSVDIAFESLQELQFATEREGGSLQSLQQSLLSLSQRAGEAFRGMGEGVQVFGLLGIEIRDVNGQIKTSDILLEDLAEAFQRFDKVQQIEFANKLGISPDLLLLLQKGGKNLRELRLEARSLGLVSEETARNSEQFQDSLTDLRFTVRSLFTNIAGDLLPTVIDLVDRLKNWFQENKAIVKQNVTKMVKVLTKSIAFLIKNMRILLLILVSIGAIKIIGFFTNLVLVVITLVGAIKGLNANLTITNFLIGAMPLLIGLAIAAMIALVLIWQDLKVLAEGGESFFGRIAEDSDKARRRVELLVKTFQILEGAAITIADIFDRAFESIEAIIDIIGSAGSLTGSFFKNLIGFNDPNIFGGTLPNVAGAGNTTNTTTITAPITITSQNGDPEAIGVAVQTAIEDVVRNGMKSQPITVTV